MESDTDVDAIPVPARPETADDVHLAVIQYNDNQQRSSNQADNGHEHEQNHFDVEQTNALSDVLPPNGRWKFNRLRLDISDALTKDDLNRMKLMYTGEIGCGSLEKITNATILFTLMERRKELSPVNLLRLCALLHIAKRNDLLQVVAEYSKKTKNAIYIEQPSCTPVNGYRHVEFHVAGRDIPTHGEVQSLRRIVSALLCVPEQFVLIDGASRSSSITITILLPELHVTILQNFLETDEPDIVHLALYGVDTVTIGEKVYHIQAVYFDPIDDVEQPQLDMFQELQNTKSALSDTELENLILKEKLKNLEQTVEQLQAENDVWIRSVKPSELFPDGKNGVHQEKSKQTIPDDIEKALDNFNKSLGKMSETSYDRQVVLVLLQAHATLIASVCHSQLSSLIAISNIQQKNVFHDMVMAKIVTDLHNFIGLTDVIHVQTTLRGLTAISSRITTGEKQKLQNEHQWTEEENELVESGEVPVFVMLIRKEVKNAGRDSEDGMTLKDFLQKYLSKIDRLDLLQVFEETTRQVVAEERPQDTGNRKPSANKQEANEETMDELMKKVELLIEKVDKIDNNLNVMNKIPSIENMMPIREEYATLMMFQQLPKPQLVNV